MKLQKNWVCSSAAVALAFLGCAGSAIGQTFSSGSTGADGPLTLTATNTTTPVTVRAGGVYHYTTVNIGATHTLRFNRGPDNAPVVILATGDVTIAGTIDISGNPGAAPAGFGVSGPQNGAFGGPGGFNGGNGGINNGPPPAAGQGPGGGAPSLGQGASGGTYAASSAFVALTPLFGGSGGGGGGGSFNFLAGGAGGGGGGAILIASNTRIVLNGTIRSNGGDPLPNNGANCNAIAAAGAGGAIRLVAPEIVGAGHLRALRGIHVSPNSSCFPFMAPPGDGRIRLEAFAPIGFAGSTSPIASVATAPGAVSPAGNPALLNVPTLAITSIGNLPVPAQRNASYFAPDLALAPGTSNPVPVVVEATNTPVGAPTVITVRLMPPGAAPTHVAVPAASHTGSFASSSATASVSLPVGQVTVIQAFAAMTLTGQTASLFPLIDGEPVERVTVAATPGQASTLSLVTRSGKEVPLEQLPAEDRVRVALAWEAMKATSRQ